MENLTDSEREILLQNLEERLAQLENQRIKLEADKEGIISVIRKLKAQEPKSDGSIKRQSLLKGHDFTWKTIALEILKDKRRVMTTDEVYSEFIQLKPEFNGIEKKKNLQASFSSALSQLSELNEVVKIDRKFAKGSYWGLPDWFPFPDGQPLPEIREQLERYQINGFIYAQNSL